MLKEIRSRLTLKEIGLLKLAVWVCLVVWMVFFLVNSLILAHMAGAAVVLWYPGIWGQIVMKWVLPVWIIFTSLLIITGIARWARKKLS